MGAAIATLAVMLVVSVACAAVMKGDGDGMGDA